MEQRQLAAIVITASGKRVAVGLPDDGAGASFLARLQQHLRRLLGL